MILSTQSQVLYQTLLNSPCPLSVKQLASYLKIPPSLTYRLTEPLLSMGLITKTIDYPYQFSAKPIDEGLSLFLLHQNDWFSHQFSPPNKKPPIKDKKIPESQEISLTFVQSRDELMSES